MSCFKLKSWFLPLGFVIATLTLAWASPTARALQKPRADDPIEMKTKDSDLMRVEWLNLNPTGSRAKFEMPAKPRFVERTFTPVKGRPPIKVRLYIATTSEGSVNFTFSYNDMAELPRGAKGLANSLEGVIRGSLANVSGQLISKTDIKLKGVQGRQFAYGFTDNTGKQYIALSRAFIKRRRLYQLSTVTDGQAFDETVAARFLNSFKIVRAKSDLPPVPKGPPKSESAK